VEELSSKYHLVVSTHGEILKIENKIKLGKSEIEILEDMSNAVKDFILKDESFDPNKLNEEDKESE